MEEGIVFLLGLLINALDFVKMSNIFSFSSSSRIII